MLNQERIAKLKDIVAGQRDLMFAAERHIWKHPETGYREWETHKYLAEKYKELGYELVEAGRLGVKSGAGFYDYSGDQADAAIRERDRIYIELAKVLYFKK